MSMHFESFDSANDRPDKKQPYYCNLRDGFHYDVEFQLPDFESHSDSEKECYLRKKVLANSVSPSCLELAEKLDGCSDEELCGSAACPFDTRQYRQWLLAELIHLGWEYDFPQLLTVLFYDEMMTDKELYGCDFKRLKERLWRQLKRAGFSNPVIGTLEFDCHTECGLWLPHFHLIVMDDRDAVEKLRRYFKKQKRPDYSSTISRPFHVRDVRSKAEAFSYVCKLYSTRVEAYLDDNGKRRTKKYRLKDKQLRLSIRVYDRLGFSGLLFLYGVRRVGNELRVTSVNDK